MLSTSYSQVPSFLNLHSLANHILLIFLKKYFILFYLFLSFGSFISTLFFFFLGGSFSCLYTVSTSSTFNTIVIT